MQFPEKRTGLEILRRRWADYYDTDVRFIDSLVPVASTSAHSCRLDTLEVQLKVAERRDGQHDYAIMMAIDHSIDMSPIELFTQRLLSHSYTQRRRLLVTSCYRNFLVRAIYKDCYQFSSTALTFLSVSLYIVAFVNLFY